MPSNSTSISASGEATKKLRSCINVNQSEFVFRDRNGWQCVEKKLENTCHDSNFAMEKPIRGSMVGGLL